jgi:CRISPR-associated protein Cas2
MYVLVTYDVSTTTPAGKSRLRRVAKTCLDFGQRVQNSVFECKVDPAQLVDLKSRLMDIIDKESDSVRFIISVRTGITKWSTTGPSRDTMLKAR